MSYTMEPEVSGELGEKTIIDTSIHPPIVRYLQFVFYVWLGDDILECFPVFLISEKLKHNLEETNLTGYKITDDLEIEISEEFKLLQPHTIIPNFYRFEIHGGLRDDFRIVKNLLNISDGAYLFLSQYNIDNAIVIKAN